MENLFSLTGKVAVVTGGSRGIGLAMAQALAAHGASVVLAARKEDALNRAVMGIEARGGKAHPVVAHTGKPQDVEALMAQSVAHFGQVDILINNAATNPYFGPFLSLEDAAYHKTLEVNLKGALDLSRLMARHLSDRGAGGSIINVSSVLGMGAAPAQGVYGMTKAALISMTKTLAVEWGSLGIRVNAIAPGLVKTQFAASLTQDPDLSARAVARTALNRLGEPQDLAGAAVFLASGASAYVTGHVLVVDGGITAGVI